MFITRLEYDAENEEGYIQGVCRKYNELTQKVEYSYDFWISVGPDELVINVMQGRGNNVPVISKRVKRVYKPAAVAKFDDKVIYSTYNVKDFTLKVIGDDLFSVWTEKMIEYYTGIAA